MKIKILEFKAYQGNEVKIQSHKLKNGLWKKNPKFDEHKMLISQSPSRFIRWKEYKIDVKDK